MDFQTIDTIMAAKGIATDPAFDAVRIAVEPTPNINGCPLGLYYPDEAAIILPPDAVEGALLHELGHRHGHYYYANLSEAYAESFRERYQGGRVLLYQGNHFENMPKFGVLFEEGQKGAVEVALAYPLTLDELYEIKQQLHHYNESPPKLYYGGGETPFLRFEFTRGVDWMVIIGSSLSALAMGTVGVIAYAVYKVAKDLPWVAPVVMFGTAATFILAMAVRQEKVRGRLAI